MAVPGVELVIGMILERAVPPAIESIKRLYANMGWAKDRKREQLVQTEVGLAIERAASLARVIPDDHLQPYLEQSLQNFKETLLQAQIPPDDADQLTKALGRQIDTTIIEPLKHLNQVRNRLDNLEKESSQTTLKVAKLEEQVDRLAAANQAFGSKLWFALGALATLTIVSAALALVALVR